MTPIKPRLERLETRLTRPKWSSEDRERAFALWAKMIEQQGGTGHERPGFVVLLGSGARVLLPHDSIPMRRVRERQP